MEKYKKKQEEVLARIKKEAIGRDKKRRAKITERYEKAVQHTKDVMQGRKQGKMSKEAKLERFDQKTSYGSHQTRMETKTASERVQFKKRIAKIEKSNIDKKK